jgi:hypothetical protein
MTNQIGVKFSGDHRTMHRSILSSLCLFVLVGATSSALAQPVYVRAHSADAAKVIVVSFQLSGDRVEPGEAVLTYGVVRSLPPSGSDFSVDLLSSRETLQTKSFADPRKVIAERRGNVVLSQGTLTVRFAYRPAASNVRLRAQNNRVLANVDLRGLLERFCRDNQRDPICRR